MIAFLLSPLGRGLAAGVGIVAFVALLWWRVDAAAYRRGYEARITEEITAIKERTDAANRADDDARRCAADPACRLREDPFRRD